MNNYELLKNFLEKNPKIWLITGVAGFIGSNLLEELLGLNQIVIGMDNFSSGTKKNLEEVRVSVGEPLWKNFTLVEGCITDLNKCKEALQNVDFVLHQAALGSVPRSMEDPTYTHFVNTDGSITLLNLLKNQTKTKMVFASSSSVYGDSTYLPKVENNLGNPLSPYAASKLTVEIYAETFHHCFGISSIGLRYFNVFGKRQDPDGDYAAVIPKWIKAISSNDLTYINGDGKNSRDFTHISNVVQANILAACSSKSFDIYNVALGSKISLNDLFLKIKEEVEYFGHSYHKSPIYRQMRDGDIVHSFADISKIKLDLGFEPQTKFSDGLRQTVEYYLNHGEL
jgi:UDP-N-acetylglucosamine 4-epimerase